MPFDAIVHAPRLRPGARLNIAEADQTDAHHPSPLTIGAELRLRIGVCAPQRACGRITGCTADPESIDLTVVDLVIGAATWRLHRGAHGGVAAPGLVSETWYVVAVIDGTASPIDHSPAYSPGQATAED